MRHTSIILQDEAEEIVLASELETDVSRLQKYSSLFLKGTLASLGSTAGILYFKPAKACAKSSSCGMWLSNVVTTDLAIAFYSIGGVDFSLINAFYSSKSIEAFYRYLKKQSTAAKIFKGSFIILYTLSQDVPTLIVAGKTSDSNWETVLSSLGTLPSALFGTVGLMENEIPYLLAKLQYYSFQLRYHAISYLIPNRALDISYHAYLQHYLKQHAIFLEKLKDRWHYTVIHTNRIPIHTHHDLLKYLFNQHIIPTKSSTTAKIMHRIGQFAGLGLAANFSSTFFSNTFDTIQNYIPTLPLQILSTIILMSSGSYGDFYLTMSGGAKIFDLLYDIASGNGIRSLAFQLRPKLTTLICILSLVASTFSYALMNLLFEEQFPEVSKRRDISRILENVGMGFFHLSGLMHTYHLFLGILSKEQREQFLFTIEAEVERFERFTLSEFIKFCENNDETTNELYEIELYESVEIINDDLENSNEHEDIYPQQTDNSSNYTNSWCSWFCSKKEAYTKAIIQTSDSTFSLTPK